MILGHYGAFKLGADLKRLSNPPNVGILNGKNPDNAPIRKKGIRVGYPATMRLITAATMNVTLLSAIAR